MSSNGIRTTNLERQFSIDELLGNVTADGVEKTARIPMQALTNQLAGSGPFILGNTIYTLTKGALDAITPANPNMGGVVLQGTAAGYYAREGSSWVKGRGFPDTFAELTVTGGTANAIQATAAAGVSPADVEVFFIEPTAANTGAVTLSVNGASAKPIRDVNGQALTAGLLAAGRLVMLHDSGSEYRLLSDPDADGAAASAAASAAAAAQSAIDAQAGLGRPFDNKADAEAYAPITAPEFIDLAGYYAAGDGGGARYKKIASEPSHAGKFSITLAVSGTVVWYEIAEFILDPLMLGAVGYAGYVEDFKPLIASATDDYAAIQATIDLLDARGGGVMRLTRWHKSNTPLRLGYQVSIDGIGYDQCGIFKDSDTTLAVTYYGVASGTLVVSYPGALPTNANAVLILGKDAVSGRWVGKLNNVGIGGTLEDPEDAESWKVEFGILNVGAVSYVDISHNFIQTVERAMTLPSIWVSEIHQNHMWRCRSGLGIENGTSTDVITNYANSCRDFGFGIRSLLYSYIQTNAVDFLNDPDLYPDRTRECSAYIFNSLEGCTILSNGQEWTYGNSLVLNGLNNCTVMSNTALDLGSDYTGTADIAFIKVVGFLILCEVTGNNAYGIKPAGLTFGGANPAKHHNLWDAGAYWNGTTFNNNVARDSRSGGLDAEGAWLNNNIVDRVSIKRGGLALGKDWPSGRRLAVQGFGSTSSTYAAEISNSAGLNLLSLRDDGYLTSAAVYNQTTGGGTNVHVAADGGVYRSTSALKYKDVVGEIPSEVIDAVMQIAGFIYTEKGVEDGREYIGLAADHFHEAGLHWFVQYGPEGEVEGLMYERLTAVLIEQGRRMDARLTALEARIADL